MARTMRGVVARQRRVLVGVVDRLGDVAVRNVVPLGGKQRAARLGVVEQHAQPLLHREIDAANRASAAQKAQQVRAPLPERRLARERRLEHLHQQLLSLARQRPVVLDRAAHALQQSAGRIGRAPRRQTARQRRVIERRERRQLVEHAAAQQQPLEQVEQRLVLGVAGRAQTTANRAEQVEHARQRRQQALLVGVGVDRRGARHGTTLQRMLLLFGTLSGQNARMHASRIGTSLAMHRGNELLLLRASIAIVVVVVIIIITIDVGGNVVGRLVRKRVFLRARRRGRRHLRHFVGLYNRRQCTDACHSAAMMLLLVLLLERGGGRRRRGRRLAKHLGDILLQRGTCEWPRFGKARVNSTQNHRHSRALRFAQKIRTLQKRFAESVRDKAREARLEETGGQIQPAQLYCNAHLMQQIQQRIGPRHRAGCSAETVSAAVDAEASAARSRPQMRRRGRQIQQCLPRDRLRSARRILQTPRRGPPRRSRRRTRRASSTPPTRTYAAHSSTSRTSVVSRRRRAITDAGSSLIVLLVMTVCFIFLFTKSATLLQLSATLTSTSLATRRALHLPSLSTLAPWCWRQSAQPVRCSRPTSGRRCTSTAARRRSSTPWRTAPRAPPSADTTRARTTPRRRRRPCTSRTTALERLPHTSLQRVSVSSER
jgi:hypothetical protein